MSERPGRSGSGLGRYFTSRKNTAGMVGACGGVLAGVVGTLDVPAIPVVAVGAYAVLALLVPNRRDEQAAPAEPSLLDGLRTELDTLRTTVRRNDLPAKVPRAVEQIASVLERIVERLGEPPETFEDRQAYPDRLASAAGMVRDVGRSVAMYTRRSPDTPQRVAAGELANQLKLVGGAVDRLAAELRRIPDPGTRRTQELTDELSRLYPPQQ